MKYIITESQSIRIKVKRMLPVIDNLVKYLMDEVYNSKVSPRKDFYDYYMNPEVLYNTIEEALKETMYYRYFEYLDDTGEEWKEVWRMISKYMETVWRDKMINHYTEIWNK